MKSKKRDTFWADFERMVIEARSRYLALQNELNTIHGLFGQLSQVGRPARHNRRRTASTMPTGQIIARFDRQQGSKKAAVRSAAGEARRMAGIRRYHARRRREKATTKK